MPIPNKSFRLAVLAGVFVLGLVAYMWTQVESQQRQTASLRDQLERMTNRIDLLTEVVEAASARAVRAEENSRTAAEARDKALLQRGIDIRQRDASETCKPVRSCMNEFGREFVAPTRQRPGLQAVTKVHSRRAHRHYGNVDPGIVHERDHRLFGPLKRRQASDGSVRIICLLPE